MGIDAATATTVSVNSSSVIFPSITGTLKSHLTRTLLPAALMSSTVFLFSIYCIPP